jgi:putative glutamine amidotransferase
MRPRIAIPLPHSTDPEYAERAIPQYERAVELAGGEPVRIPLDQTPAEISEMIKRCDGVLLPGSKADIDPEIYAARKGEKTEAPDAKRYTVDELLLQDAFANRKPILGICFGLQSLNVYRSGSLIQHIPDFLPEDLRTRVNHEAGKAVAVAHDAEIEADSKLAEIVTSRTRSSKSEVRRPIVIPVNSSHHQSADKIGEGLRIVARCTADHIIEAIEGTAPDHFVLAVQWHPERSVDQDEASRAIFRALIQAGHSEVRERTSGS